MTEAVSAGLGLAKSVALARRADERTPGGVNSNVRLSARPRFFEYGRGARIWDADGNEYIDYVLGQGPALLGHGAEVITLAVTAAAKDGLVFGGQHRLEVEAAELFCDAVQWPEMVRFAMSGTEAVQAALRLARAATNRQRFIRFEGHYHGWVDSVLVAPAPGPRARPGSIGQPQEALDPCIVLPWNDADVLTAVLREQGEEVSAVLMEPVMLNSGSIEPIPGYLETVRRLCSEHNVLLIFDETITGFRVSLGGAAERFGIAPDLAIYGKAMAGGWPVAALAGRRDVMELLGSGDVNHSGTFNGNTMSLAATVATIRLLREVSPYGRVEEFGRELMGGLAERARDRSIALTTTGLPIAFHASIGGKTQMQDWRDLQTCDTERYVNLVALLARFGVWTTSRGLWYVSAAHGPHDVDETLERVDMALAAL